MTYNGNNASRPYNYFLSFQVSSLTYRC